LGLLLLVGIILALLYRRSRAQSNDVSKHQSVPASPYRSTADSTVVELAPPGPPLPIRGANGYPHQSQYYQPAAVAANPEIPPVNPEQPPNPEQPTNWDEGEHDTELSKVETEHMEELA